MLYHLVMGTTSPLAGVEKGLSVMQEALGDLIESAERNRKYGVRPVAEMPYRQMKQLFKKVEQCRGEHVSGFIVFRKDSFLSSQTINSRTYRVSSDNKAFQPGGDEHSIYGSCKDGKDPNARLDQHMAAEFGGKFGWKIERCYMNMCEVHKAKEIIGRNRVQER